VTAAICGRTILFAAVSLLSSCSFFSRQPALPRHAAIESAGSDEKFAGLIEDADIIYFPSESVALGSRTEPAWRLLEALRRNQSSFAFGWDWAGTDRDHRDFLAEAGKSAARILALCAPSQIRDDALLIEQSAAAEIAAYFGQHRGEKILVFLAREHLGRDHGVPYFVAQKTRARQLILNPKRPKPSGAGLLARK
jgi:hypothetical protein